MVVNFDKYILKREKNKMSPELKNQELENQGLENQGLDNQELNIIKEIRENRENNKIYSVREMEKVTHQILKETKSENEIVIPIISIANKMKFSVFKKSLIFNFLSGYIKINKNNIKKYKNDKIICTNERVNHYQQRFVIAHELAHFLFDYDYKSPVYFNTYIKNSHNEESERRANAFAANLLMPKDKFITEYKKALAIDPDPIFLVAYLSYIFKAPRKAVQKRITEVNYHAPAKYTIPKN